MPPKKRTVSNADQAAPSRKNQKRANDQQAEQAAGPEEAENAVQEIEEGEESSSSEDLSKKDPQEWICMDRPFWDFKLAPDLEDEEGGEREDEEEGDSDDEGPNSLRERYEKQVIAKKLFAKPAAEFPQHKWKILWDAWMQIVNLTNQESYRQPDNFDIYMWSHHYNYAIMGLVEDSVRVSLLNFVALDR